MEEKIKEMIEQMRPYINMDGGDITFVKYEDKYVYVRLSGACSDCIGIHITLNNNLYPIFKAKFPRLKAL